MTGAGRKAPGRPRAEDVDRHVGLRVRDRRIMLGLTQQQLADLVGVTYQQLHKYERGLNRIPANRLPALARALGVGVDYFFKGAGGAAPAEATPQRRMLLGLARDFAAIPSRGHREALCALARAIGGVEEGKEAEAAGAFDRELFPVPGGLSGHFPGGP